MPNVIGYARVSTTDQDPQMQLDALSAAGSARIFTDTASGRAADRPQLREALAYLNPGDTLAVYRLDRLARSTADAVRLMGELNSRGIEFRSLTEAIDTRSPGGRMVYTVMAAVATLEAEIISERTKAGLAAARAQGRVGGRPTVMTDERRRLAKVMAGEGKNNTEIGKALGVSRTTAAKLRAAP
ncbi:recombinase family protein [Pseudarthrobacter sp. J47]|uniref:recombinase family protein n=1 Tax=Pseudarthrobacter sp. J47 TaxID=3116482 RepID=UPI002E808EFB|nr:recombinase family protein [Pseudarthrobacter sp. J47]MEE2524500.1 recombinase family protein [Pseudarthrobacter sp. J47]